MTGEEVKEQIVKDYGLWLGWAVLHPVVSAAVSLVVGFLLGHFL
jgi:hypothetical protein